MRCGSPCRPSLCHRVCDTSADSYSVACISGKPSRITSARVMSSSGSRRTSVNSMHQRIRQEQDLLFSEVSDPCTFQPVALDRRLWRITPTRSRRVIQAVKKLPLRDLSGCPVRSETGPQVWNSFHVLRPTTKLGRWYSIHGINSQAPARCWLEDGFPPRADEKCVHSGSMQTAS